MTMSVTATHRIVMQQLQCLAETLHSIITRQAFKIVPGYVLHITTKLGSKKKVTNNSHCTHSTPYTNLKIM